MSFFSQSLRATRDHDYVNVVPSAARTTTSQTAAIDAGNTPETIQLFVNCTAASGTSPNLVVSLEVSPDGGTTWYPSVAATALTAAGQKTITASVYTANTTPITRIYRVKWTITGTTPSFTFSVDSYVTRS